MGKGKKISNDHNQSRNWVTPFIAFLALILSVLTYVGFVYDLRLKNRPYLYVNIVQPDTWLYTAPKTGTPGNRKIRVGIRIYNKGVIPASNIKFNWYIATNMDGKLIGPDEFYKLDYGKESQYKTIFPEESIKLPDYKPDISPATEKLYLNVLISYEGIARNFLGFFGRYRRYWYLSKTEFNFAYPNPETVLITPIYFENDWDRDEDTKPAKIEP